MAEPKKMDLKSMSITEDQKAKLRQIFPEAFNEDKIDLDKLRRTLGEEIDAGEERFGMTWPGKNECFRVIQEPSVATLKPDKEESIDWDNTENLFIEGDNLEVLKLLQRAYYGKVKMIYIDPPYNTGKEFIYPDKYSESLETYLTYTGQVNAEGVKFSTNTETEGRFHSKWMNMMCPRLFLARNLLREDGVIFISIDDNEVKNLRSLMDEIFGQANFIGCVVWNSTKSVTNTALISVSHNFKLIYAKNIDYFIKNRSHFRVPESGEGFDNPDNDPRGPWKADPFQVGGWRPNQQYEVVNPNTNEVYHPNPGCSWKNDYDKFQELLKDNRIVFGTTGEAGPQRKRFLSEALERGRVAKTWWDEVGTTTNGTQELKRLFDNKAVFSNPKPIDLLKKIIQLGDYTKNSIILDFFAGSCPTAQAVIELNRESDSTHKFIMVQLPESIDPNDKEQKVVHEFCQSIEKPANIAEIGKERIRRVIKKIQEEQAEIDLGFRVFKLDKSNFGIWDGVVNEDGDVSDQLEMFIDHIDPDSSDEDILYEILLKSGFELITKIEELDMAGKKVYSISDNALLICLDRKLTKEVITEMARLQPARVVCLDAGFADNDQLKTNAVQIMKSHDVEDFRTI